MYIYIYTPYYTYTYKHMPHYKVPNIIKSEVQDF